VSAHRARCSNCKVDIGLTDDGLRFLYHHAQGPGIGPVCPESGELVDKTQEVEL
jgi:hypothetical protein